ncbi:c-type cytochrome [Sulfurisoma sediminicola]|uniref:Cytochrome c oxidase cbb3-type subunit 3 n=1 Tax=Sulfurisoma sediminicola TaxID=1381557 RepID=A0A497X945_9PROT|nr:c-type cytochrome [Sulfurisoma sediminicola]RLJ62762.1 cytochrome c oxidase cbb3-type subunit 3 [Sulfurisoma sediminicola]
MRPAIPSLLLALLPALSALADDGARLYAQNCAACHGERGSGGIGVPLALPSIRALTTEEYLRRSIRHGRPGRVMPAFASLSAAEVDAIVAHMGSWNPGRPAEYAETRIPGDLANGGKLFQKHCASCHGATGEGGKGTGVTLSRPREQTIMAPALHNAGFLASTTDLQIKAILTQGVTGTPMVSFVRKGLKEQDIDDLVAFVRNFEQSPLARPDAGKPAPEPVLSVESPYDLKTTVANLKRAAETNNFIFIREQTLDEGIVPPGRENHNQQIVYVCNFGLLAQALNTDPRVGLFLPCRFTILEQAGKVTMMASNPKRLSQIFNNSELDEMCEKLTKMYLTIMEDATL